MSKIPNEGIDQIEICREHFFRVVEAQLEAGQPDGRLETAERILSNIILHGEKMLDYNADNIGIALNAMSTALSSALGVLEASNIEVSPNFMQEMKKTAASYSSSFLN